MVMVAVGVGVGVGVGVDDAWPIFTVNCFEAESVPLVAFTVNVYVPAVVGVPEILPLRRAKSSPAALPIFNPGGSEPAEISQFQVDSHEDTSELIEILSL